MRFAARFANAISDRMQFSDHTRRKKRPHNDAGRVDNDFFNALSTLSRVLPHSERAFQKEYHQLAV